jgi:phosphatidylinositol alpha 1,6-mannosyltransferase
VGYVGRLAAEKRVHILKALSQRSDLVVVIIGDGPERAHLAQLMPRAVFLGRLEGEALGAAMATLDVLVAPGENETFCQVVQEAMASGVPVVAPAVAGPADLIDDNITGLLYPPGDDGAMCTLVDRLVSHRIVRERIVNSARSSVSGRSWSALGLQLIQHYQDARDLHTWKEATQWTVAA